MPPTLTRAAVRGLVRHALKHGLPREEAEDVVARAWERAAPRFDPGRASFEALLRRTVEREAIEWWRDRKRWLEVRARLHAEPTLPDLPVSPAAAENQQQLLDRLTARERRVFAAWALQEGATVVTWRSELDHLALAEDILAQRE